MFFPANILFKEDPLNQSESSPPAIGVIGRQNLIADQALDYARTRPYLSINPSVWRC
jgi:anionic cell wall polymer biosynthesis LytR-Cps2A-Psr (LCP) family protein